MAPGVNQCARSHLGAGGRKSTAVLTGSQGQGEVAGKVVEGDRNKAA